MKLCCLKDCLTQEKTLIIPLYKDDKLPLEILEALHYDLLADVDLSYGNVTSTLTMKKMSMKKMLILGLGERGILTRTKLRKIVGKLIKAENSDVCIWLDSLESELYSLDTAIFDVVYGIRYSTYTYLKKTDIQVTFGSNQDVKSIITKAEMFINCINHARDLGNAPSNLMQPKHLADYAELLAKELDVKYEILSNKELKEIGAGALLGVNQASSHDAYLITLWYQGAGSDPYTAFVGKAITFDAGGYNLKKPESMRGMKFDMCGGANVLGAFEWIVRSKQKVNVMAVVAATENMLGSNGFTCDNVLVSLSGKTIEVTNTDAEGRLILCDAITYAQQKGAKRVIDVATLTGAVVAALGKKYTGVFTNSENLLSKLKVAALKAEEKVWELPVDEDFHSQLKTSDVADMVNAVYGGKGGASLAAAFLEEFVDDEVEWVHVDIAGTADVKEGSDYTAKGATGAMVETLGTMFE